MTREIKAWMIGALAWSLASACASHAPDSSTGGTGGKPVDYQGTTGSGDEQLNGDLAGQPDTKDPSKPSCLPGSILDADGGCVPPCVEAGGVCADNDPTRCMGHPAVQAYDCMTCCTIPGGGPGCPQGGCTEPDCPPGEDCTYTDTCPDGQCGAGENCASCPIDCGPCPEICGDGVCTPGRETCFSCPDDCGNCPSGCGDGMCAIGKETCETCPDDCGQCLKVMTWDIDAALAHGTSNVASTLSSIGDLILLEKPDYVGLESVDQNTKRSGRVDEALFIARRVKMYERFGGAFNYDGGQYGLAFLSKHPIAKMTKLDLPTSGEWALRRIVLTATLDPPNFYTDFDLAVTALARSDAARLMQANTIAAGIGFEADAMLIGDLYEAPTGPAVMALQANMNLLDLWPMYGMGQGPTTSTARFDYVMAGLNWWNQGPAGTCATVVRMYAIPAKGLSSHRPVVALFQQGFKGIDCGTGNGPGGDDTGAITAGDMPCVDDHDCLGDPVFRFCLAGYCSQCRDDSDCTDPAAPTCDATNVCF